MTGITGELHIWQPFPICDVALSAAAVRVREHSVCTVQSATLHYSLCDSESVYAWIHTATDPCVKPPPQPAESSQDSIRLYLSAVTPPPRHRLLTHYNDGAIRGAPKKA